MMIEAFALSDIGRRRRINADAALIDKDAGVVAVADGMGDLPRSAAIAQRALDALRDVFSAPCDVFPVPWARLPPAERWPTLAGELLMRGVAQANRSLYAPEHRQPLGTTLAAVVACCEHLCVAHAGDSRVYLLRASSGRLLRLTEDDTVLSRELARGMPLHQATTQPHAHALTRVIGMGLEIPIRPYTLGWGPGDLVMACTDGLTNSMSSERIERLLHTCEGNLCAAARRLVSEANAADGRDNVTVVLARRTV